ncbi:hypothetical protein V5O48_019106 [Marasmius crinis-equi]|uniref:Ubiquitin-like protease family profile domain-containing protein n=1 Tax=Marasmius crinis-equi TaxID=585013 RepID=A0ABR3EJB1_9AGAR
MKDLRRFPEEVGVQLKKTIREELEDPSYYWPGRFRTNNSRWAIFWQSAEQPTPAYIIDRYPDRYAELSKLSPPTPSQPSPSPSQSPADPHTQECDLAQHSPSPSPQKRMDIDSSETLRGGAKSGGEARAGSDMDMNVDENDTLAAETRKEVGEIPNDRVTGGREGVPRETNRETRSPEDGMDIDRDAEIMGKAKEKEIPSAEEGRNVVTKGPKGDSKTIDPSQDNRGIAETGGNAETGEFVEEPWDDKSNKATPDLAGTVVDDSDSDYEWVSDKIPLKRTLRTKEQQRKRLKVEHPLQMTKGRPKDLFVEPAGIPWFVGADLCTLDQEMRSLLSKVGTELLDADNIKRLEVPTEKLNDDLVEFAARALQIFHRDERCALFGPLTTEKLMGQMTSAKQSETWPSLGKGKWPYWLKGVWIFPVFLREAGHWALGVVKAETRQILLFDSLGMAWELSAATRRIQIAIQRAVQDAEEHGHTIAFPSLRCLEGWTVNQLQPRAVQTTNYIECGLWMLFVASGVFRGYDYCRMDETYIPQFREFLARLTRLPKSVPPPANAVTPTPVGPLSPKAHAPVLQAPLLGEDQASKRIANTPCSAESSSLPEESATAVEPPPVQAPGEAIQASSS